MSSEGTTNFTGLAINGEDLVINVINATTTFDPASIAAAAGVVSSAVSVPGASLGDAVVIYPPYDISGIVVGGCVSGADEVKISLFNTTAEAIDLDEAVWKIKVLKG